MLSPDDLLRLPYTPDLTEGGIAYALRSLSYKNLSCDQLRQISLGGQSWNWHSGVIFRSRRFHLRSHLPHHSPTLPDTMSYSAGIAAM